MTTLELIGMALTLILGVGCFLLKGIHTDTTDMKVSIKALSVDLSHEKKTISENKLEIYKLRDRMHTVEGRDATLLSFIDTYEKSKSDA